MRLSYLRYALKSSTSSSELLETEAERLHLSPDLAAILPQFIPAGVPPVKGVNIPA